MRYRLTVLGLKRLFFMRMLFRDGTGCFEEFYKVFDFFKKSSLQIRIYGLIYRKVVESCKNWQEVE